MKTLRDFARHVEERARAQGPAAEAELAALLGWAARERRAMGQRQHRPARDARTR